MVFCKMVPQIHLSPKYSECAVKVRDRHCKVGKSENFYYLQLQIRAVQNSCNPHTAIRLGNIFTYSKTHLYLVESIKPQMFQHL